MENESKVENARKILEDMTNVFGCRTDLEALANKMAYMHRTLVQSFTSGFIIPFVRELAHMKRNGRFDGRNQSACEACLSMCEALEAKYEIGEADDFSLPCI